MADNRMPKDIGIDFDELPFVNTTAFGVQEKEGTPTIPAALERLLASKGKRADDICEMTVCPVTEAPGVERSLVKNYEWQSKNSKFHRKIKSFHRKWNQ